MMEGDRDLRLKGASLALGRDPTPQHSDLVPEHQDLCFVDGVTSHQGHQPAERPDKEQVDETDQHERRA